MNSAGALETWGEIETLTHIKAYTKVNLKWVTEL